MTVLVTGASGHVGANLTRALLARGDEVRVLLHRRSRALDGLVVERVTGDVLDRDSLQSAVRGVDVVYHLAAVISIDGDKGGLVSAVNIDGPRNVAQVALSAGVGRMVHCSSIHAFDQEPLDRPVDETRSRSDERAGHPAYDVSKSRGERAVREVVGRGLDAVIVNPTAVIGPWDFERSRMGRVFLDLYHRRLPSLIEGGFDWVDVRDVCAGIVAAGERGRTGESYLLGGHHATVVELSAIVERLTGVSPPRITSPMWLARVGAPFVVAFGRVVGKEPLYTTEALRALRANRVVSTHKAEAELGYASRPLDETVRDTLGWYAEHGMLPPRALRDSAA